MSQYGQSPYQRPDPQKYIEQKIIEPLLAFRRTVSPLNQIHINAVDQFAKTIDGLLTGSDGDVAFQGPGSMALANLIGQYLDREEKLTGSYPDMLQGRLLDVSIICEKHAHELQQNNQAMSHGMAQAFLLGPPPGQVLEAPGGNAPEQQGDETGGNDTQGQQVEEQSANSEMDAFRVPYDNELDNVANAVSLEELP